MLYVGKLYFDILFNCELWFDSLDQMLLGLAILLLLNVNLHVHNGNVISKLISLL